MMVSRLFYTGRCLQVSASGPGGRRMSIKTRRPFTGRRTADGGRPYIVLQEFSMSEELADKKCVPCRGGVPPLKGQELKKLHDSIPGWEVVSEHHLHREFRFPDFKQALDFVNRIGAIAEPDGHHPDLLLASCEVGLPLAPDTVPGLPQRDSILARTAARRPPPPPLLHGLDNHHPPPSPAAPTQLPNLPCGEHP